MARFTNGWVKLHRDALEKDLSQNIYLWGLWWWLVANANWKDSQIIWNGQQKVLPPGSVVLGAKQLGVLWNCSHTTIWKWINYLRDTGRIAYETCTRGTIVTICNWKEYQVSEEEVLTPSVHEVDAKCTPSVHEVDAKCTPSVHEVELSKEGKKVKREEGKKVRMKDLTPGIRFEYPKDFDRVWNLYGRKGDKKASYLEYQRLALADEELNTLAISIKNYHSRQPEIRFRKDLERFLKTDWREWLNPVKETGRIDLSTQKRLDVFSEWAAEEEIRERTLDV